MSNPDDLPVDALAAFSRNGHTSPMGKLDETVGGFRVQSIVRARFLQRCAALGVCESELIRDIYTYIALGEEESYRLAQERVNVVKRMLDRSQ